MSTSAKIRLLLALLCVSLFLTAVVIEKTYSPQNDLRQTARVLEQNLQKKESYINSIITDKGYWNSLKTLETNEDEGLNWIQRITTQKRIWLVTFTDNKISFWTGLKVIPQHPEFLKEGRSFFRQPNGYYEAIKKSEGDFTAIFFIPVKAEYPFQNQYLQNVFDPDLIKDNNIDLADFTDKKVYSVHSIDGNYLFSLKPNGNKINHQFYDYEISIWILTFICLCALVNNLSNYIARKTNLAKGLLFLVSFIILLRFVNLHFHWPSLRTFGLFNPDYFHAGRFFPSLGDFCINILMVLWVAGFLYNYRFKLARRVTNKLYGYTLLAASAAALFLIAGVLLNFFQQLVIRSSISFDISNVLNLSSYSLLGILMLGFGFLIFTLLNEILLVISKKIDIPVIHKITILVIEALVATILTFFSGSGSIFYFLIASLILIRGYSVWYENGQITALSFISLVFICALISALNLNDFEAIKEHIHRKALAEKLQAGGDVNAERLFPKIEKIIVKDSVLIKSITHGNPGNAEMLKSYFQKNYLEGNLSQYEFKIYEFDKDGRSTDPDKKYVLDAFKEMVLYSSLTKISSYFYRENKNFGVQQYFAILPIYVGDELQGTYVLQLKTRPLQYTGTFPEILIDGHFNNQDVFKGYSYAFYEDNKLLSQKGEYTYNLINTDFKPRLKQYVFINQFSHGGQWWQYFTTNSHLIYQPNARDFIVITRQEHPYIRNITSLTFFFVTLLAFYAIVLVTRWLWARLTIISFEHNAIRWNIKLNLDGVLYKTRIQFSMVFAVVITLLLVGFVTYVSISHQYQDQQDNIIRGKIGQIAEAFQINNNINLNHITEEDQLWFNDFAKTNSADLTLFNKNGVPVLTTVPKIYDEGLVSKRMNGKAFVLLNKLHKSEFVNAEVIGSLNYKAAYAPIRNSKNITVAYLQLPYFSNEADYSEYIGSLLNAMINIYALIFLAIGLFAIVVARQITNPLSIIQYNLSKTIYGQNNEPIRWERDDEIGGLVKEYNKMISALEESARKLAQSERENAWREMAKQVAHEIKNPLTPLKLGLQLLEKSWKDKDPKFDQKFERFSKSFVEQIESLSSIASEFSAFAKMPETRIEKLNIFDTINQATTIFRQTNDLTINYQPPEQPFYINADRDQLLRCFNNLLKNAIEAMPSDKPGLIQIDFTISAKNILITIKDNGKGIPENLRERIFEPNFTTKSSGTGLGLAFVKNSIENAGGKVWYETAINEGTTFYLSLPMA